MTQTLFPPIGEEDNITSDILSPELRENFRRLRSFLTSQELQSMEALNNMDENYFSRDRNNKRSRTDEQRKTQDKKVNRSDTSSPVNWIHAPNTPNKPNFLVPERVQLAARTLVAAENEISLLSNGIAELESLLALNAESDYVDFSNDVVNNDEGNEIVTHSYIRTTAPENKLHPTRSSGMLHQKSLS